jgi:hypothetical protein
MIEDIIVHHRQQDIIDHIITIITIIQIGGLDLLLLVVLLLQEV